MKTLLALRGAGNRGKSASLCRLIEMIRAAYPAATFEEKRYKVDVTLIVTIGSAKIGIETQGDPTSRLGKSLERFIQLKCQVIVCACRSYGATVNIVRAAGASGYQSSGSRNRRTKIRVNMPLQTKRWLWNCLKRSKPQLTPTHGECQDAAMSGRYPAGAAFYEAAVVKSRER